MQPGKFDDEDLKEALLAFGAKTREMARRAGSKIRSKVDSEVGPKLGGKLGAKLGSAASGEPVGLDPATVEESCWRQMKRNRRTWPSYVEAPNCYTVQVSAADWDAYWGVGRQRKQQAIAQSLAQRASSHELWLDGQVPTVLIERSEQLSVGQCEVRASFVEKDDAGSQPQPQPQPQPRAAAARAAHMSTAQVDDADVAEVAGFDDAAYARPTRTVWVSRTPLAGEAARRGGTSPAGDEAQADGVPAMPAVEPPVDTLDEDPDEGVTAHPLVRDTTRKAWLVNGPFCLMVRSGDILGAIGQGREVPPEVNVRLDASAFRYVAPKHLGFSYEKGQWLVVGYAERGTTVRLGTGERYVIRAGECLPIQDGDQLELGAERPLTFRTQAAQQ